MFAVIGWAIVAIVVAVLLLAAIGLVSLTRRR
jgi:hypothetical protein